jgi:Kef-type K+ transport system membrane component KefB
LIAHLSLQVAVILAMGWVAASLARRMGLSAAVGQMVMGLVLGPSLLGVLAPGLFAWLFTSAPMEPLAWLARAGVILLMFHIGLEFDVSHFRHPRNQRAVAAVSVAALAAPFVTGLVFGRATAPVLSPGIDAWASALFVATAFSITALPILQELGIQRTELGVIAIGAAAINDVAGWILLAIVSAFTQSPWGIVAVLGAFACGMALHRREAFVAGWNRRVGPAAGLVLLPIYFTYTGLRTDAGSLEGPAAWGWCAAVIAVASASKFWAAYVAARWSGLAPRAAAALGAMMNTRGLVELVVLNIGYDLGLISKGMFTMLVLMAVLCTAVTTPLLRRWLALPHLAPQQPRDAHHEFR